MKQHLSDEEFNQRALAADPSPEKALYWLSYYADEVGDAFGKMKHADLHRKVVRSEQYDASPPGSNQDCAHFAERSPEYKQAILDYQNACADYMRLNILKEAAVLKITLYQSKLKHSREGHPS